MTPLQQARERVWETLRAHARLCDIEAPSAEAAIDAALDGLIAAVCVATDVEPEYGAGLHEERRQRAEAQRRQDFESGWRACDLRTGKTTSGEIGHLVDEDVAAYLASRKETP